MDKTLKSCVIILTILFSSCNHEKSPFLSTTDVIVKFKPWFTFDYGSRVLMLRFDGQDAITDTLHLSKDELKLIEKSFSENGIGKIEGEVRLGHFNEFPSSAYIIDILRNNKTQGSLYWESDYRKGNRNREKHYVEFCVNLINIISSKKEFSKMEDLSLQKQIEYLQYIYENKKK